MFVLILWYLHVFVTSRVDNILYIIKSIVIVMIAFMNCWQSNRMWNESMSRSFACYIVCFGVSKSSFLFSLTSAYFSQNPTQMQNQVVSDSCQPVLRFVSCIVPKVQESRNEMYLELAEQKAEKEKLLGTTITGWIWKLHPSWFGTESILWYLGHWLPTQMSWILIHFCLEMSCLW